MKFETSDISESYTGSEIKEYEKIIYDGELDGYKIYFENGYVMEIDRDEITEEDLKFLINKKIYVDIKYRLSVWKGRYPND